MVTPKNARGRPVTKLCLALETFRRTEEGRVRDARAFLSHFFPQDRDGSRDRLFVHMPKEVRADLLSSWGIRGKKSALRDDDEKVRVTVTDALAAGDIDATVIEEGVTPETLIDWVPLEDWWTFWRGSTLPVVSIRRALADARDLSLFDERWFLEHLKLTSQKVAGTDVIGAALSKEQVTAWIRAVHQSGDASPTGLVAALGWETVLAKTAHEALTSALDALARQIGLVDAPADRRASDPPKPISKRPAAPDEQKEPPATLEPRTTAQRQPVKPASKQAEPSRPPPLAVTPARVADPSAPVVVSPIQVVLPSTPKAKPDKPVATGIVEHPATRVAGPDVPPPSASPVSGPPNARALFGLPADLPPMRPPAATLSGVGAPPLFEGSSTTSVAEVAIPTFAMPGEEPPWAPPRAEPGDMGWDLVYGVKRPMATNVQPKYNFDDDDEPTSEIALPGDSRRPRA